MEDLFSVGSNSQFGLTLSESMRPSEISEIFGQNQITSGSLPWDQVLKSGHLPSLILWGPPGTGKTSLARVIGQKIRAEFVAANAVDTGAKILRELSEAGRQRRLRELRRTLVFIDEIHRLSKAQQDVLLPAVESGDIILIGATTEHPGYELNSALLSRCRVLTFNRLEKNALEKILARTLEKKNIASESMLTPQALEALIQYSDGDGRRLINAIEIVFEIFLSTKKVEYLWPLGDGPLRSLLAEKFLLFDSKGDQHYDLISAFIKSVRGSDPDAALYYLARMIKGGEDPKFIARRLVILASEDVSNADPRALPLAVAGFQAVEMIGLPEAAINLAQVATYLAAAPKSNRSYVGLHRAYDVVETTGSVSVPPALRSAQTKLAQSMGFGREYKYSHDGDRGYQRQDFFPKEIKTRDFYEPTDHGFEKNIGQYLAWLRGSAEKKD